MHAMPLMIGILCVLAVAYRYYSAFLAARVASLKARIEALQVRLADVQKKQTGYLAQLAIHELDEQKTRLAAYQVQARFALASMYDRAANEDTTHKEPGAALPKGSKPDDDTPTTMEPADKAPAPEATPPATIPPAPAPAPAAPAPDAGSSGSPKP